MSLPPVRQSSVGPLSAKIGNGVPAPPSPFGTKWTLALPTAKRVALAAGPSMFFVAMDGEPLRAYWLADAKPAWTADVQPDVPLVTGEGLLFVAEGESVRALDQATGKPRWTIATGALAVAPTWQPGWLFTPAKDGSVAAWRTSDGSPVWKQNLGSPASARIAVDGEQLFVGLGDRRLVCLRILADGQPLWTATFKGVAGELLAAAGRLYFGTSDYGFFCVKQENGKLDWPPHREVHSTVIGRPVIDDQRIWIATLNNLVTALSRGNGEIDFMQTLPSRPAEQLAADGGQVIVPLESGQLAIFNQRDGKPIRPPAPPPAAAAAPAAPTAGDTTVPSSPLLPTPPGTRIAAPLVPAGSPEAPVFLRITLAADARHTVTAFERSGRSCAFAFLPCQMFK